MTEVRIGRVLAASLHAAISELLPDRLEFYEYWLNPEGFRDGSIGAGPVSAVLGFLRTEGPSYDLVMRRAGQLATRWTVAGLAPVHRSALAWLPRPLRVRAALRLAASIVRAVHSDSRATTRIRGRHADVEVTGSPFCTVREAHPAPLCGFYVSVAVETLQQLGVSATARAVRCRAIEGTTCLVNVDVTSAESAEPAVAA